MLHASVHRLTNSIMMHGRNNGKKLMAVSASCPAAAVWKGFSVGYDSSAGVRRGGTACRSKQLVERLGGQGGMA